MSTLTHGHAMHGFETSEYRAWQSMLARCLNPRLKCYKNYGGRGIRVCDRWARSFESFLKDMGPKPTKLHSLDRINNNDDYTQENCRWATTKTQNNNSRNCRSIVLNGRSYSAMQLCEIYGFTHTQLIWRLNNGWPIEKALSTPVRNWTKGTAELAPQL